MKFKALKRGDNNDAVLVIQRELTRLGFRLEANGKYDKNTVRAVRQAKIAHGWPNQLGTFAGVRFQRAMAGWVTELTHPEPQPKPKPKPVDKHSQFRAKVVAGYESIMGAKEGGTLQKLIAKFCGIASSVAWCGATLWYVLVKKAGYKGELPPNPLFVPSWELWAQEKGILVKFKDAKAGMQLTFKWNGKRRIGTGDHIGVIIKPGILRHKIVYNPVTAGGNESNMVKQSRKFWWQVNTVFDVSKLQP